MTLATPNHAPLNSTPGAQPLDAQQTVIFSAANGNAITVGDTDGELLEVQLFVSNGTLSATAASAATVGAGAVEGGFGLTIVGTAADINATLSGLTYVGSHQADSLLVTTFDNGLLTDTDAVQLTFVGIDHAPTASVPVAQTLTANGSLAFNATNGNALTVADADGDTLTATVAVEHGALTATASGTTALSGEGTDQLTLTGSAADINATLNTLTYQQSNGYHFTETLSLGVSDGGFNIQGEVGLTSSAPDHQPKLGLPGGQIIGGNHTITFSNANNNALTVSDADGDTLAITLSVSKGTLSAVAAGAATITTDDSNPNTFLLTVSGTAADINATLNGLQYVETAGVSGSDTITANITDVTFNSTSQFGTGLGGEIELAAADLAPTNHVPATQTLATDGSITFSTANGNAISIVDPENGTINIQLAADDEQATLTATAVGQATVTPFGTQLLIDGPLADVNATLNGLHYQAPVYNHGADRLFIRTSDGTSTIESYVGLSPSQKFQPVANQVPGEQSIAADGSVTFGSAHGNAITISAPGGDIVQTTISAANGVVTPTVQSFGTATVQPTDADHPDLVIVGTAADITALLNGAIYQEGPDSNGPDALDVTTTDGVFTIDSKVALTPSIPDHAPTVAVPGAQTLSAQHAVTFSNANGNAITVADADGDTLAVTIFGDHGSGDTPIVTAAGAATATVRFGQVRISGSVADVNATLNGLQWIQGAFNQGSEALHIQVGDSTYGIERDVALVAAGDADHPPVMTVPGNQTLAPTGAVIFSSANGNAILVADADADPLTVTLKVNDGSLAATAAGSASVDTEPGSEFSPFVMTVTGSAADVAATLNGLTYQANVGFHAADTLSVQTADATFSLTDSLLLLPASQNHAPATTLPTGQFIGANGSITFGPGTGNAITVSDADGDALTMTLEVQGGELNAVAAGAATVEPGGSGFLTITGSVADINATLNGLKYQETADRDDTLQITLSDGTVESDSEVALASPRVDRAPSSNVPAGQLLAADGSLVFSTANGNAITVADIDGDQLNTNIRVQHGKLQVVAAGSATVFSNNSTFVEISGSAADINATLNGLQYHADAAGASDTLQIETSELGPFSISTENSNEVGLSAQPAHAPTLLLPGGQLIGSDQTITFSSANGNGITVADPDSATLTVVLSTPDGDFSAVAQGSATAFHEPALVIQGSVADVNATLNTLVYQERAGYFANDLVDVRVSDGGFTTEATLVLTGRNHAPTNTLPTAQTIGANGSIVFNTANGNAITVADADNNALRTTVSVTAGTLTATAAGAASVFGSDSDSILILGTAADISATLNGLTYHSTGGINATLTVETTESSPNGFSDGTPLQGNFDIVSSVGLAAPTIDQPPVDTVPGAQTTGQGQNLAFGSAHGNAITVTDPAGDALSTEIFVEYGLLSAIAAGAAQVTSVAFNVGDIVITGSAADITATLATLQYHPFAGYHGQDTLNVETSDGNLLDADTIAITVTNPHALGVYSGPRGEYDVHAFLGDDGVLYTQVTDKGAAGDGVDTIAAATHLQFADGSIDFAGADLNHISNVDGSRFDDVLVQNDSTGQLIFGQMADGQFQSWQALSAFGNTWQAVGSGNVVNATNDQWPWGNADGAGTAATFLQSTTNGAIIDVQVNNQLNFVATNLIVPSLADQGNGTSSWHLRAVADVNGDASVDLVIQSDVKGEVLYGDLADGAFQGWHVVVADMSTQPGGTSDFKVVGAGDINRDGFADIVIQNQLNGKVDFINMAGGAFSGWGTLPGLNATWQVKAVADVTGDGYADIVVQHQGDGQTIYADMHGGVFSGWDAVASVADRPNGSSDWAVTGVADVNNDGRTDVLFQTTDTTPSGMPQGTIEYAEVNGGGTGIPTWGSVGIASGWHVA